MWQHRAGLGNYPRTLLEELARIQSHDVVLPIATHGEIRLRCVTQPDFAQSALIDRPGVVLPKRMRLADATGTVLAPTAGLRLGFTKKCSGDFFAKSLIFLGRGVDSAQVGLAHPMNTGADPIEYAGGLRVRAVHSMINRESALLSFLRRQQAARTTRQQRRRRPSTSH